MKLLRIGAPVAAAAILTIGLTACGGAKTASGGTPATTAGTSAPAPDVTPTTDASEPATPAAQIRDRPVGRSGRDGNLVFTVNNVQAVTSVSQNYAAPAVPVRGGKFVLAKVTVRNDGQKGAMPFCGGLDTTMIDSRDRNFQMDDQIAISVPGNALCDNLDPGFQAQYQLVFQLPKTAQAVALAFWDSDQAGDFDGSSSWVRVSPL